jgi:hypothetical protein
LAGELLPRSFAATKGVLKAMLLRKLKPSTGVVFALAVVGAGVGFLTHDTFAAGTGKRGPKTVTLTDANYTKLREYVHPTAVELAWRRIPWIPSVWEGIVEGQRRDRPILMWILNGHPLACT